MESMEEFLDSYVKRNSIPFRRGTPRKFAAWLVKVFNLFTLPPIRDSPIDNVFEVKCLYGLWNVVIDDRIDCDHDGREDLIDIISVVQRGLSGESMYARTASGQIMKDFLERFFAFSKGANSAVAKEFLFLDLLRVINAFDYERIVLTNSSIVTLPEFMEFSTSTVDVRCMLDIDLALIQEKIHPRTIGKLREVYKILGMAFRLFNDLVSLEREFYTENSLNSVILSGIEKGILPRNVLSLPNGEKTRIYREDIPLLYEDIWAQIDLHKKNAVSRISQITEMNLDSIARSFDTIVERVSSEGYIKDR